MELAQSYDHLYDVVRYVPLEEIRNVCVVNAPMKRVLCDNPGFWVQRIREDYDITNFNFLIMGINNDVPVSIKYVLYLQKIRESIRGFVPNIQNYISGSYRPTGPSDSSYWNLAVFLINYFRSIGSKAITKLAPEMIDIIRKFYIVLLTELGSIKDREYAVRIIRSMADLNLTYNVSDIMGLGGQELSFGLDIMASKLASVMTNLLRIGGDQAARMLSQIKVDTVNSNSVDYMNYYLTYITSAFVANYSVENIQNAFDNLLNIPVSNAESGIYWSYLSWIMIYIFDVAPQLFVLLLNKITSKHSAFPLYFISTLENLYFEHMHNQPLTPIQVEILIDLMTNPNSSTLFDMSFVSNIDVDRVGVANKLRLDEAYQSYVLRQPQAEEDDDDEDEE